MGLLYELHFQVYANFVSEVVTTHIRCALYSGVLAISVPHTVPCTVTIQLLPLRESVRMLSLRGHAPTHGNARSGLRIDDVGALAHLGTPWIASDCL